jgi:hypothetical protein
METEIVPGESEPAQSWLGCRVGTGLIIGDIVSPATDEDDWETLR